MARKNKLSPTQEKVLNDIRSQIIEARGYTTYEEYFLAVEAPHFNSPITPEQYQAQAPRTWERNKQKWEELLRGEARTRCSGSTLYKLEKLGYINILEDGTGCKSCSDRVKLIEN